MEYKHLIDIPQEIRQPYIRETARQIVKDKLENKIDYIKLLRSVDK
jgi:cation transport regulator ChaB